MTALDLLRAHPGQALGAGAIMFALDLSVQQWTTERRELERAEGVVMQGDRRGRTYTYTGPAARPDALTWRARNGGTEWVAVVGARELCVFREADGQRWNAAVAGRVLAEHGVRRSWPSRAEAADAAVRATVAP